MWCRRAGTRGEGTMRRRRRCRFIRPPRKGNNASILPLQIFRQRMPKLLSHKMRLRRGSSAAFIDRLPCAAGRRGVAVTRRVAWPRRSLPLRGRRFPGPWRRLSPVWVRRGGDALGLFLWTVCSGAAVMRVVSTFFSPVCSRLSISSRAVESWVWRVVASLTALATAASRSLGNASALARRAASSCSLAASAVRGTGEILFKSAFSFQS